MPLALKRKRCTAVEIGPATASITGATYINRMEARKEWKRFHVCTSPGTTEIERRAAKLVFTVNPPSKRSRKSCRATTARGLAANSTTNTTFRDKGTGYVPLAQK